MKTTMKTTLPDGEWLVSGGLLYRLKDGVNCDEINVTMAAGVRDDAVRQAVAVRLQGLMAALSQPILSAGVAGDEPKVIDIGHGATLQRQTKTTGAVAWLMYNEHGLVRSLNALETQLVEAALRAALASAQPVAAMPEAGQSVHALKLLNDIALWWHADKLGVTDGNPKEFEDLMERAELFMLKAKRLATMSADAQSKGGA